jgi:hypothetical protein
MSLTLRATLRCTCKGIIAIVLDVLHIYCVLTLVANPIRPNYFFPLSVLDTELTTRVAGVTISITKTLRIAVAYAVQDAASVPIIHKFSVGLVASNTVHFFVARATDPFASKGIIAIVLDLFRVTGVRTLITDSVVRPINSIPCTVFDPL